MSDDTRPDDPTETRTMRADELPTARAETDLPERIGDYRILGRLGEGGMGVVYEAEQQNPHRRVAIKVVRGGVLVDERRLRMFQREADTLARLRHSNIAAIYEAGRTEAGEHFFAMELVRGSTLSEFIAERSKKPDKAEVAFRLRLFEKICRAAHYAHQRGVIHRDLKPANVLVVAESETDGLPELKVLDFGLARITDSDVAAASIVTEVGVIQGTLAYMSPEQARGNPAEIDIRTDVYSLGVILFEMLTGERPLEVNQASLVDAVRTICEDEPSRLQQSWSGTGRPDHDLETIVGKTLEKDVERRYAGADVLREDVHRYLASQPILATPPSNTYLLRKFAVRNRALVGGVIATFLVLVAGVVASTVLGLGEARQRRKAEAARDDLSAVVKFQSAMIGSLDPEETGIRILETLKVRIAEVEKRAGRSEGEVAERLAAIDLAVSNVNPTDFARSVLDRNILQPAAETATAGFTDRAEIESLLLVQIATTYRDLGLREEALPHLERAIELRSSTFGADDPRTLHARETLAELQTLREEHAVAELLFEDLLVRWRRLKDDDDPAALRISVKLAGVQWEQGKSEESESRLTTTLELQRAVLEPDDLDLADSMLDLGVIHYHQGRYEEVEPLWNEALEIQRNHSEIGPEHRATLKTQIKTAGLYLKLGQAERAEQLYRETLEIQQRRQGDDHPDTLRTLGSLALLYKDTGRPDEAIALHHQTLDRRRSVLGEEHPLTLRSMNNLATTLVDSGQLDEALTLLTDLAELNARVQPGSPDHAVHTHTLGELQMAMGDWAAAAGSLREALEVYRHNGHRYAGLALYQLGQTASARGRKAEAISYLTAALEAGYTRGWKADAPEFAALRGHADFERLLERTE